MNERRDIVTTQDHSIPMEVTPRLSWRKSIAAQHLRCQKNKFPSYVANGKSSVTVHKKLA